MSKQIHLHIGTHKTGTTALQQTLAENREQLVQQGFLYPQAGWHQFAQHFLAFEKKGQVNTGMSAEVEGVWEALREEIETRCLSQPPRWRIIRLAAAQWSW